MEPVSVLKQSVREIDVEDYTLRAMKRYLWCDLASGILDAYLIFYMIRGVDLTGRSKEYIRIFAHLCRVYFLTKIPIHGILIPFYTFSVSLGKTRILSESTNKSESHLINEIPDYLKAVQPIQPVSAKRLLMGKWEDKVSLFVKLLLVVYGTALLLVTDHGLHRMLDIALMSLWVVVGSFGVFIHFIYLPDSIALEDSSANKVDLQHPRLPSAICMYSALMLAGWALGNYISILDWDDPFMHFPNGNYIGLCIGHLAATVAVKININL